MCGQWGYLTVLLALQNTSAKLVKRKAALSQRILQAGRKHTNTHTQIAFIIPHTDTHP